MSPSKKPFNPKRVVSAGRIPRKRGLSQKGLNRLQELQGKDLGNIKSMQRLWELKYKPKFDKLVSSFPPEHKRIGKMLLDASSPKEAFDSLKKLFSVEKQVGFEKVNKIVELLLSNPDRVLSYHFAFAISRLKATRFIPLLEKLAKNHSYDVCAPSIFVLGELRSVNSVPLLETLSIYPDVYIRETAVNALEKIRESQRRGKIKHFFGRLGKKGGN